MKSLTQILYDKGTITAISADKWKRQFSDLCQKGSGELHTKFSSFSPQYVRLDAFYYGVIGEDLEFEEIFVVCLVLMLSHGVESGFSVIADMQNLHKHSLIVQCTVYCAVQMALLGHYWEVVVVFVRGSEAVEREHKAACEEDQQVASRKRDTGQIKLLEAKKQNEFLFRVSRQIAVMTLQVHFKAIYAYYS